MIRSLACLALVGVWVTAVPARYDPVNRTEITALAFAPDGRTVLSAGLDGQVRFWDAVRGKERLHIEAHKDGVFGIAVSLDGKRFASAGADGKVRLWDLAKVRELQTLTGHEGPAIGVAFSPDARTLASAGADGTVRLWDAATGKTLNILRGHTHKVTAVAFSADGRVLASGGIVPPERGISGSTQGDRVRLWDPAAGKPLAQLAQRGHRVAYSTDGQVLVSAGMYQNALGNGRLDGGSCIALWDVRRDRELSPLKEYWHAIGLSGDGRYLASGWGTQLHQGGIFLSHGNRNKGIHLWELATTSEVLRLEVPEDAAAALALSPDGTRLAAGRMNGTVTFPDLAPRTLTAEQRGPPSDAELRRRWEQLGSADAAVAYEAVWRLTAAGDQAVAFFTQQLRPTPPSTAPVERLIADLDSERFEVRDAAARELAKIGGEAVPTLRRALLGRPSLEQRRRVEALLDAALGYPRSPEDLRQSRAIAVLERVGSKRAEEFLRKLAAGAPAVRLTRESQASWERLARRDARLR